MQRDATGHHDITSTAGETVRAFLPEPLPPDPPLDLGGLGQTRFVPPPPGLVEGCMAELERFIHADDDLPVLVKAALAHVQFETIHPFLDGNGRLGRRLIVLKLVDGGLLRQPQPIACWTCSGASR